MKRKITSVQTKKTYRGSGSIEAPILKLGARRRRVVGFLPRPFHNAKGQDFHSSPNIIGTVKSRKRDGRGILHAYQAI